MPEELLPKPEIIAPAPEQPVIVKNESPKHHGKSPILKFLLLGFLVALILATISGAYVLGRNSVYKELNPASPAIPPADPDMYKGTPTPDPTADWQTYEGDGFNFKYPLGWTEVKIDNLVRFFPPGSEPENQSIATGTSEYIEIFTSELDPKTCRGDCAPSGTLVNANDLGKINPANYKTSEGFIGGMCGCEVDKIYLKNGNSYYTIGLYGITDIEKTPPAISTENEMIFQQILSTFKFKN